MLISIQAPIGSEKSYLEKAVYSIFSPLQHGISFMFKKIVDFWENYFNLVEVKKKNEQLKEEMFFLRQENNFLRRALENIRNVENIKEFISTLHESFIVAQVIGIDARNVYASISIDRGSMDGVMRDMVVLDKNGNLVGRIVDPVSLKGAMVQLITDKESGVGIFTSMTNAKGVLTGEKNGECILKYIYATQNVLEEEELITSGLDGIYPFGIKVGVIDSIYSDYSIFKKIKVKPYFQPKDLDKVVVILRNSKENLKIE